MSKKKGGGMIYSTNEHFDFTEETEGELSLNPESQNLYVSLDRKMRKGKTVTLIEGFIGSDDDFSKLAKMLKNKCGTGGAVKEGNILVQGDFKLKINDLLIKEGYRVKMKGGK
ncbi:MAG: translation initiation factor 1 [Patiriisocius sp.]|jgi:translation initiation factor 1